MLFPSCGEGVLPSSEALALSSECDQVKEFNRRQTGNRALFIANLQSLVLRPELIHRGSNVAGPLRIRPGESRRRIDLVGVQEALQFYPVVADKGDVQQAVLRQLVLHAHEEILHVTVPGVFRNVRNVVCGGVERGGQALREALIHGAIAGCTWLRLGYETNSALGALIARMSPEPARV